jgi:hypothetical protein
MTRSLTLVTQLKMISLNKNQIIFYYLLSLIMYINSTKCKYTYIFFKFSVIFLNILSTYNIFNISNFRTLTAPTDVTVTAK